MIETAINRTHSIYKFKTYCSSLVGFNTSIKQSREGSSIFAAAYFFKQTSLLLFLLFFTAISLNAQVHLNKEIKYCANQARKTLSAIPDSTSICLPRSIKAGDKDWRFVDYKDWTSGFWPGTLWYLFEATKDSNFRKLAHKFSMELEPLSKEKAYDHDLGFQIFCSFGNGYRITKNPLYKKIILATADTLATLYNSKVGTILSWPREVTTFGAHNTIIDNMINLELLFWASKNGGNKKLYKMAETHALTTMKNHFREDNSSYHVVLYDSVTGKKIKGITHQGYSDNSMWARGQSWAIYGFTMCYRETKNPVFLSFAQKVADVYLRKLPKDLIPYWDFNAPDISNAPKDVSAACVTASALLELCTFVKDSAKAKLYKAKALKILQVLSTSYYQSREKNSAFLLHSTGHKPKNSEVDVSINYADYYFIEALLRLKK